jgi:hypothetical protein
LFFALLIIAIVVAVGLGAGLGAGLGLKKKSSTSNSNTPNTQSNSTNAPASTYTGDPKLAIGGVLDSKYYSTKGAFNGSGIAFAGQSFSKDQGFFTVYFQHHTGSIRWMQLNLQGSYVGGTASEVVATDAKNSTPISVVAYTSDNEAKWSVFYIGKDGTIKQRSNSNTTNVWSNGPVNDLKLKALDADSVGLQACWYGNFYGDSDASTFPTANGQTNQEAFDISKGMHLWYASDETTFQQYGIYEGQDQWVYQEKWEGYQGHAGVGCYSYVNIQASDSKC